MKRAPLALLLTALIVAGCGKESKNPAAPAINPPSGLVYSRPGTGGVRLVWEDNSFNEAGFRIERKQMGVSEWETLAEVEADVVTYTDPTPTEGNVYEYRVRAFVRDVVSLPTNTVSVAIPPNPPTNLTAVQDTVNRQTIRLSWTDNSSVETAFRIERKRTGEDFQQIAELPENSTGYEDTGLERGVTYTYRVQSVKDTLVSGWSAEARATTVVYTPNAPVSLTANPISYQEISLVWVSRSSNEDGFVLERSTSMGGGWAVIDTTRAGVTSYSNRNLQSETTYYYRIYAFNRFGNSDYSNVASATTPMGPPLAPTNLVADTLSFREIMLTWNDNSTDELGFRVQKHGAQTTTWDDFATVGASNGTSVSIIDDTVVPSTTYYYRVNAFKVNSATGDTLRSAWSNIVVATTPPGPPPTPSRLDAEASGMHQISVTWGAVPNADNILIERRVAGGRWNQLQALSGRTTAFLDNGVDINTWYAYRVMAVNARGASDYSNVDSARTVPLVLPAVIEETLEDYATGSPPPSPPWDITITNPTETWVQVSEARPHNGSKSLLIHDANTTDAVRLFLNHDRLTEGVVSAWIYLPSANSIGMLFYDSGQAVNFRLEFVGDGRLVYYWGNPTNQTNYYTVRPSGDFPFDQWMHIIAVFNIQNQTYSLSINNRVILTDTHFLLTLNAHPDNARVEFLSFGNTTLVDGFVDDVAIYQSAAAAAPAASSPSVPVGLTRPVRIQLGAAMSAE